MPTADASWLAELLYGGDRVALTKAAAALLFAPSVAVVAYILWRRSNSSGSLPYLGERLMAGTLVPRSGRPMLLSGASDGADATFGAHALAAGHDVAHLMGPRNDVSEAVRKSRAHSQCVNWVSDALLDGAVLNAAFERVLRQRMAASVDADEERTCWRDSRRNYLQVCLADVVYAVAYRTVTTDGSPALDIGGGTGWACQVRLRAKHAPACDTPLRLRFWCCMRSELGRATRGGRRDGSREMRSCGGCRLRSQFYVNRFANKKPASKRASRPCDGCYAEDPANCHVRSHCCPH